MKEYMIVNTLHGFADGEIVEAETMYEAELEAETHLSQIGYDEYCEENNCAMYPFEVEEIQ